MTSKEYQKIRKELGLTLKEMAKLLGVDWTTICRRENNKVSISKEVSYAIIYVKENHSKNKKDKK